jgi:predicted nucleotidyltransferase
MDAEEALADVAQRRAELADARRVAQDATRALVEAIVTASKSGAGQRAIAEKAKVSQPYISKLTRGHRRFLPQSKLGQLITAKREDVLRVVHAYGADNVVVFGSVAAGTDSPDSDIDLMVDIPDSMGLFTLARMEQDVRDVLGVDVDVIPSRLAKPEVRGSAAKVAVPL